MSKSPLKQRRSSNWSRHPFEMTPIEADFTILQASEELEGIITVDALLHRDESEGNEWLRAVGVAFEEPDRELILGNLQRFHRQLRSWRKPRVEKVFVFQGRPASPSKEASIRTLESDWITDSGEVLSHLERSEQSLEELTRCMLAVESIEFAKDQVPRLLSALANWISELRFSDDEETKLVVAAAIRKYTMNMSEDDFVTVARWFEPTDTETLSSDLELEFSKAVCWRLTYVECLGGAVHSEMRQSLHSLMHDYLTKRLILQENFAAIALNSSVAASLLAVLAGDNRDFQETLAQVRSLGMNWFSDLFERRVEQSLNTLASSSPRLAGNIEEALSTLKQH